jgi:hypothetical protein
MLLKDRLGKPEYVILTGLGEFCASDSDRNRGTVNSVCLMPFDPSGENRCPATTEWIENS